MERNSLTGKAKGFYRNTKRGAKKLSKDAKNAASKDTTKQRILRVRYKDELKKWEVAGPTGGFGVYDTKKEATQKAKQVYNDKELYGRLAIETKDGAVSMSESRGMNNELKDVAGDPDERGKQGFVGTFKQGVSKLSSDASRAADKASESSGDGASGGLFGGGMDNEGGPTLPGMDMGNDEQGSGPMLPSFGGGGMDNEGEPQLPGFGGIDGQEGGTGPTLPGFGGGGDMSGGPMLPGFGVPQRDEEEEEESDVETTPYGYRDI